MTLPGEAVPFVKVNARVPVQVGRPSLAPPPACALEAHPPGPLEG
jgi:hypothetical protein